MRDFIKRLLIAGIMAVFISLLFIGVRYPQAEMKDTQGTANHWMWPTDGVVTDTYGTRKGRHHGIDIAGSLGTPVHSVDEGVVTKSYYSSSYGHVVFVKHTNNLETVYAHLSKRKVQEGQAVKQGDVIGEMGSTGRSSGVHLHFEVHNHEWTVNKRNSLNPSNVIGSITVGETVQAMVEQHENEQVAGVTETTASLSNVEEESVPPLLEDNYMLLGVGPKISTDQQNEENKEMDETSQVNKKERSVDNVVEKVVHVVKKGDNLWNIAKQYETSVGFIMTTNDLKNDVIVPNQELIIEAVSSENYIVKPGDSLSSIAKGLDTSVDNLKKMNQLKSDVIHPNQVLVIDKE